MLFNIQNYIYISKRLLVVAKQCSVLSWQPVIGIEVHAQIEANTKLFSGASTRFAAPINSQVAPFDAALPGTLPVINQRCVEAAVKTAIALRSNINSVSTFDRKHYFYADLPAGYQITQQRKPLARGGQLSYVTLDNISKRMIEKVARITQIQLEQDSGKSVHDISNSYSLIDLNRAGVALMEIITEPDFTCGYDAAMFVRELQQLLVTIKACDGKMAEGSLRVDASVSIHHKGEPLGVRTEIKNLNSTKMLNKAIEYEIERQISLVENGGIVTNETRSFDPETGKTVMMRDKERLHDYRFMPEPNLPPLRLNSNDYNLSKTGSTKMVSISAMKADMPTLPSEERHRLCRVLGLSLEQANTLQSNPAMFLYYNNALGLKSESSPTIIFLLLNQLVSICNRLELPLSTCSVSHFGELVDLVMQKKLSRQAADTVMEELLGTQYGSVQAIVARHGWNELINDEEVSQACEKVLQKHPEARVKYAKEKTRQRVLTFLVKQVLTLVNNKVDAKVVVKELQLQLQNKDTK